MVLIALSGFLIPQGYARAEVTDPLLYAQGDRELYKMVLTFYEAFSQPLLMISFLLVGLADVEM